MQSSERYLIAIAAMDRYRYYGCNYGRYHRYLLPCSSGVNAWVKCSPPASNLAWIRRINHQSVTAGALNQLRVRQVLPEQVVFFL
jgi:hypothetical protein